MSPLGGEKPFLRPLLVIPSRLIKASKVDNAETTVVPLPKQVPNTRR